MIIQKKRTDEDDEEEEEDDFDANRLRVLRSKVGGDSVDSQDEDIEAILKKTCRNLENIDDSDS